MSASWNWAAATAIYLPTVCCRKTPPALPLPYPSPPPYPTEANYKSSNSFYPYPPPSLPLTRSASTQHISHRQSVTKIMCRGKKGKAGNKEKRKKRWRTKQAGKAQKLNAKRVPHLIWGRGLHACFDLNKGTAAYQRRQPTRRMRDKRGSSRLALN